MPFSAILPKPPQIGTEVILKGIIKKDAKEFSFNFINENRSNIQYHFKTNFVTDKIVKNFKILGDWGQEKREEIEWTGGPGTEFILTFHFDDNEMFVYEGDENRNFLHRFPYQFDIGDIKYVEVWGDVKFISEVIFRYKE